MRPQASRRTSVAALVVVLAPGAALAWGSAGHRAAGEIAWHYLSPQAEVAVAALLEPGPYGTLAAAGYWADAHARLYGAYDEYLRRHYVNVDPTADAIDLDRDCPEDCILTAIAILTVNLESGAPPHWMRAQDFRFLTHFVEDLHQPLHVVHPDGRGGNLTPVTLFGEETNLHSAWDTGLIEHRLESYGETDAAWKEWAYELRLEIEPAEFIEWSAALDPIVWATENIQPARDLTFEVHPGDALDEAYYEAAIPVIERRIKMAGVRLAALLNDIFSEEHSADLVGPSDRQSIFVISSERSESRDLD